MAEMMPSIPEAAEDHRTELGLPVYQQRMKAFFESPSSVYAGAMVLLSSFCSAFIMVYLFQLELRRKAEFRTGIRNILEFSDLIFPERQQMEDEEKILMFVNISITLGYENKKNEELQHAINDVLHRLSMDWVVFRGSLYLFDELARLRTWSECVEFCKKKPFTKLVCIENDAEARFLTKTVKGKGSDYWIGFFKEGDTWRYLCTEPYYSRRVYWDTSIYEPSNTGPARPDTENCVVLRKGCTHHLNCWSDIRCDHKKHCICKLKPNMKWLI